MMPWFWGLDRSPVGVHRDDFLRPIFALSPNGAHTDPMPDDEDRPRDASSAADPAWAAAAAPDDISSLSADIAAYHRELRGARRRATLRRLFARPGVTALAMTAAGFALAAIVATLLSVLDPEATSSGPSKLPLAHPTAQSAQPRGLVPDVTLRDVNGGSVSAQALRPGVLALVPLRCNCTPLLQSLAHDADESSLPLFVVAPTGSDAEVSALAGQLRSSRSALYFDSSGALANDFAASGVTLVVVDRDGTIFGVKRAVSTEADGNLTVLLSQMLDTPKVRASG
jgi:hypothetical protein